MPCSHARSVQKDSTHFVGKSTFSLDAWMSDLVRRVDQLSSFSKTSNWSSSSIWLGGLASPEAFLTATRQEAAKSKKCSLQDLHLSLSLSDGDDGFKFKGLILEGAGWDGKVLVLSDKTSNTLPPVRFVWTKTKPEVPAQSRGSSFLSECKS